MARLNGYILKEAQVRRGSQMPKWQEGKVPEIFSGGEEKKNGM